MSKFTRVRAVSGAAHEFDAPLALVLSRPERYVRITDSEDVDVARPPVFKSARRVAAVVPAAKPDPAQAAVKKAAVKKTVVKKPAGADKEEG